MALTGVLALVASLVGGLGSGWIAGAFLGSGEPLSGVYFVLFWSGAGQTPVRLLRLQVTTLAGARPSALRSLARFFGLLLSIAPLFAGFVPVLFSARRRGLADFLAGTVVVYDEPPAAGEPDPPPESLPSPGSECGNAHAVAVADLTDHPGRHACRDDAGRQIASDNRTAPPRCRRRSSRRGRR